MAVETVSAGAAGPALPFCMRVPAIPAYVVDEDDVPLIPSRPNRGPKSGVLRRDGFLMGNHTPRPPGTRPKVFGLPVRDHSMAPMLVPGDVAHFSTEQVPEPGDCILIGTTFGPEIRLYEAITESEWAGCALHPEYEHILSTEEPAWVVAVLVGVGS